MKASPTRRSSSSEPRPVRYCVLSRKSRIGGRGPEKERMNTFVAKSETLLGVALAPLDLVRQVGLVIGFSLLTAAAAQVVIPIGPIPITGQTFAVFVTVAVLGSDLGALAII